MAAVPREVFGADKKSAAIAGASGTGYGRAPAGGNVLKSPCGWLETYSAAAMTVRATSIIFRFWLLVELGILRKASSSSSPANYTTTPLALSTTFLSSRACLRSAASPQRR